LVHASKCYRSYCFSLICIPESTTMPCLSISKYNLYVWLVSRHPLA
jgi:hypothetical protein